MSLPLIQQAVAQAPCLHLYVYRMLILALLPDVYKPHKHTIWLLLFCSFPSGKHLFTLRIMCGASTSLISTHSGLFAPSFRGNSNSVLLFWVYEWRIMTCYAAWSSKLYSFLGVKRIHEKTVLNSSAHNLTV